MAGLYWLVIALWTIPNHSRPGPIADWAVAIVFFATLFVLPAGMVEWLLARRKRPLHVPVVLLLAMTFTCGLFFNTTFGNPLALIIAALVNVACLVTLAALLPDDPFYRPLAQRMGRRRRLAVWCGPAALAVLALLVAWPGPQARLPALAARSPDVPPLAVPNPGAIGPITYTRLTYGVPRSDQRVDIATEPIDGSLVMPDWHDAFLDSRTRYWGFDAARLPLAGTAWLPAGAGPFPLVLMTHGQAPMIVPSDQGFGYLGEFLASHGYLAVSVDTNFVNTNWYAIMMVPGLMLGDDFGARGYLLAEHLKQWRDWQMTPGTAIYGKVDLKNVVLLGHSRGGEAAALLADYIALLRPPIDTRINAVISLSPTDANFLPGGERVTLRDVNYLVLSSGYDGDVLSALGINQYQRAVLGPDDYFKASVFLEHATHNGFNSVWDGSNAPLPGGLLENRAPLMAPEDQRQATQVFIGAFLADAIHHRHDYAPIFRDHRRAAAWLPESADYRSKLMVGSDLLVDDFEDDDPRTTSIIGGHNTLFGPLSGSEGQAPLRSGLAGPVAYRESRVALLVWREPGGRYETTLPITATAAWRGGSQAHLVLNLAHAARLAGTAPGMDVDAPLDLTVYIRDGSGNEGRLALASIEPLAPPLDVRLFKVDLFPEWANVFSQFDLPLAGFKPAGSPLDLDRIAAIGLRFDRSPAGAVLLDDIGFCKD